jgi:hypothetical protein
MKTRSVLLNTTALLGSLFLLSCNVTGSPTLKPQPRPVEESPISGRYSMLTICQGGEGLCLFTAPNVWRLIYSKEDSSFTIEFRDLAAGLTLVKEQGHEAPGSIFLLDPSGRYILRRDLLQDMFFAEEFGERSDGAIILCNKGAVGNGWCDTWTDLPAGKHTGTTDFPEGCTWPRFLPDGSGVCWQSAEQKLSIEEGPRDGSFKAYQVPFQAPYYSRQLH